MNIKELKKKFLAKKDRKYIFKIKNFNLKNYRYILDIFNIKNPIVSSYYFKQFKKKYKSIMYRKNVQSIRKILYIKMDYKKMLKKFKIFKKSKNNNILKQDLLARTAKTTSMNTLIPIDTTLPIDTVLPKKKSIYILQSDNILKKRLDLVLPLYIYYLQMIYIHNYKYKN